jgi:hypothetical protein
VKILENGAAAKEPLLVVASGRADRVDHGPDPIRLGAGELAVLEIDVVHDLGDRPQRRVRSRA